MNINQGGIQLIKRQLILKLYCLTIFVCFSIFLNQINAALAIMRLLSEAFKNLTDPKFFYPKVKYKKAAENKLHCAQPTSVIHKIVHSFIRCFYLKQEM